MPVSPIDDGCVVFAWLFVGAHGEIPPFWSTLCEYVVAVRVAAAKPPRCEERLCRSSTPVCSATTRR